MLEPTKKRHTETVNLRFHGPADKRKEAAIAMKELGFIEDGDTDTVNWRDAFPEYTDDELPSVCLRAARRKAGMTQKELAARSGIPQSHISQMERGLLNIGTVRAKKLGEALDVGYKVFL